MNKLSKMECIICQDTGSEPVKDNTICACKYKYHSSCWIDYVHSRDKIICPLCRKDLTSKKSASTNLTHPVPIPLPYTSHVITIPQESGQITYQEFVDTIQQYTTIEVQPITPPLPLQQSPKAVLITKVLICLAILIIAIVLISIFA